MKLNAFEQVVSLSGLLFATEEVATIFENEVRPRIEEAVRKTAVELGHDPDAILKEVGASVIIEAEIEWRDEG